MRVAEGQLVISFNESNIYLLLTFGPITHTMTNSTSTLVLLIYSTLRSMCYHMIFACSFTHLQSLFFQFF